MPQILKPTNFVESLDRPVTVQELSRIGLDGKPRQRIILNGVCLVCDTIGINGRKYPLPIIRREVEYLVRTKVPYGRLAAELNHPRLNKKNIPIDYSIMEMNLWKTCAVIEDLHFEGPNLICRMVVAEGTPAGDCLAGLLRTGYHPGYSIRGTGTAHLIDPKKKDGPVEVNEDYTLVTVDVVGNPSYGEAAIFDSYMESVAAMQSDKQVLLESVDCARNFRREFCKNYKLRTGFNTFDKNVLIEALSAR